MSTTSFAVLVLGIAIAASLSSHILPLADPAHSTSDVIFAIVRLKGMYPLTLTDPSQVGILVWVVPPALLIFSLPSPISLILAWFYWYMEKTQYFFLPMAGEQ
jgi:hypothetical protein